MTSYSEANPVKVALIGAGAVSDYHHVPGLRLDPRAKLVAACDTDPDLLERRKAEWGLERVSTDYQSICADPGVDAVMIATPNYSHQPISLAAAQHGKHVMCEKPLGLNAGEVREMWHACRKAQVVHMTAFTYRFAPSMRYMRSLLHSGSLGNPGISAASDFWICRKPAGAGGSTRISAGAGDLFDMTIHRIDFAIDLLGPIAAGMRRRGQVCGSHRDRGRKTVRSVGGRRLVLLDRRICGGAGRRLGRHHAGQRIRL